MKTPKPSRIKLTILIGKKSAKAPERTEMILRAADAGNISDDIRETIETHHEMRGEKATGIYYLKVSAKPIDHVKARTVNVSRSVMMTRLSKCCRRMGEDLTLALEPGPQPDLREELHVVLQRVGVFAEGAEMLGTGLTTLDLMTAVGGLGATNAGPAEAMGSGAVAQVVETLTRTGGTEIKEAFEEALAHPVLGGLLRKFGLEEIKT